MNAPKFISLPRFTFKYRDDGPEWTCPFTSGPCMKGRCALWAELVMQVEGRDGLEPVGGYCGLFSADPSLGLNVEEVTEDDSE